MAGRRPRPFGRTVAYLVVFFLLAGIATAIFRNPFADRWVGDVYRFDASGKMTSKIEGVHLKLDIVGSSASDIHWLSNGQSTRGYRLTFSGPNRHEMLKYGFNQGHMADDDGRAPANFKHGFCALSSDNMNHSVRLPEPPKIMAMYKARTQLQAKWSDCNPINVGIQQFDQMSFVSGNNMQIAGYLERDSLMGPIMHTIVKLRFDDWSENPTF